MQAKKIKIIKVPLEGRKNLPSDMVVAERQSSTLLRLGVRASSLRTSGKML